MSTCQASRLPEILPHLEKTDAEGAVVVDVRVVDARPLQGMDWSAQKYQYGRVKRDTYKLDLEHADTRSAARRSVATVVLTHYGRLEGVLGREVDL